MSKGNGLCSFDNDTYDETGLFLAKHLSDSGKYAFSVLCSNILRDLFYYDHNKFYLDTFGFILKQLTLSLEVENCVRKMHSSHENALNLEQFITILSEEKVLNKKMELIVKELIYLALMQGEYDARWRVFIKHVAKVINASEHLETYEAAVVHYIIEERREPSEEEKILVHRREFLNKVKRYSLITAVAAGGGALFALTGGLAVPAILEGLSVVASTSAFVTALSGTGGVASITSLFGGMGASLVGYKMAKRVGGLSEFGFEQLWKGGIFKKDEIPSDKKTHLSITLAISGWIKDFEKTNFSYPWRRLFISGEQYCLRYESAHLYEVGKAMEASAVESVSEMFQNLKFTLMMSFARRFVLPLVLLDFASLVDTPWSVGCSKAILAGKQLANVLMSREYGHRPVTLIGYSLGARVIYSCLLELSYREGAEGIIEDVYLIGAPCPADPDVWSKFTRVVGGNITNAYSGSDNLLKFLYRILSLPTGGVAGVKAVQVSHKRIRNVDLSDIISGHKEYPTKLNQVLEKLNIKLIDDPQVTLLQPSCSSP